MSNKEKTVEQTVDKETGEIKETVSYAPKFNRWNPNPRKGLDYSRKLEKQFIEVAPYAKDDKGKFINESSQPILMETDPIDVDAQIQSYKDDVDIYKILEKWLLSGDNSLINPYGRKDWTQVSSTDVYDYTDFPDCIHDLADKFDGASDMLNGLDSNIVNDIVNGNKSSSDLAKEINPVQENKKEEVAKDGDNK